jgi:hypothetical protein
MLYARSAANVYAREAQHVGRLSKAKCLKTLLPCCGPGCCRKVTSESQRNVLDEGEESNAEGQTGCLPQGELSMDAN